MDDWVLVAAEGDIEPGTCHRVDVDDDMVAIYRIGDDYYAIEDRCTHDGEELASGAVEGCQVICPRHGARFNIKTGEALTAPAYEPVHTFPIRREGGNIYIRDDRWD